MSTKLRQQKKQRGQQKEGRQQKQRGNFLFPQTWNSSEPFYSVVRKETQSFSILQKPDLHLTTSEQELQIYLK